MFNMEYKDHRSFIFWNVDFLNVWSLILVKRIRPTIGSEKRCRGVGVADKTRWRNLSGRRKVSYYTAVWLLWHHFGPLFLISFEWIPHPRPLFAVFLFDEFLLKAIKIKTVTGFETNVAFETWSLRVHSFKCGHNKPKFDSLGSYLWIHQPLSLVTVRINQP